MINEKELAKKQRIEARKERIKFKFNTNLRVRSDGTFGAGGLNFWELLNKVMVVKPRSDGFYNLEDSPECRAEIIDFAKNDLKLSGTYLNNVLVITKPQVDRLIDFIAGLSDELFGLNSEDKLFLDDRWLFWSDQAAAKKAFELASGEPLTKAFSHLTGSPFSTTAAMQATTSTAAASIVPATAKK